MRVVIDTNILVSFAIRPNADFEKLFDHIAASGVSLVPVDTMAELFDVLSRDNFCKYIPLDQRLEYIEWYWGISEPVDVAEPVVACADSKDDKFLSLAVCGKADCIIAGDHHLLEMVNYKGVPIYRPAEFIRLFGK